MFIRMFIVNFITLLFLFLGLALPAYAQTDISPINLFSYVDLEILDLDDETQETLTRYVEEPQVEKYEVVAINPDDIFLADADDVSGVNLNLPGGIDVLVDEYRVDERGPDEYTLFINAGQESAGITLVVVQDYVFGSISAIDTNGDLSNYTLLPVNKELEVLLKIDQEAFPPDELSPWETEMERLNSNDLHISLIASNEERLLALDCAEDELLDEASDANITEVPVIVAYSPEARAAKGLSKNIYEKGFIQLAIATINDSFINSGINAHIKLTHSFQTSESEVGQILRDRNNFRKSNDGIMDEIHDLRESYSTIISVLLTREAPGFCGAAADILADKDYAFAVVRQDCAVDKLTFAHEIGHILGAQHHDTQRNFPFPDGKGYCSSSKKWGTIMSKAKKCGRALDRIKYWSSPDRAYKGEVIGVEGKSNNVRVLNKTLKLFQS